MAKTKKLVLSAAMPLIFGILVATLCGNAARVDSINGEFARYDAATGEVTYYNIVNDGEADSEIGGGDYSYNPEADISK